ncbi:MAG TPA: FMN-binding protein [Methylomirabilota bacterium]|jgi:uncharacterized protein with FMN-binding domain|nr:FMN-binding protein [Methylomirabilota bacterium]
MKKTLISLVLIVIFGFYTISIRKSNSGITDIGSSQIPESPANSLTPAPDSSSPSQTTPTPTTPAPGTKIQSKGQYKDGSYTGSVADAFYGNLQVKAVISGGKITDVVFLDYPHDRSTSLMINRQASVYLKQEAIQAQSANVNIVTGATDSSIAFRQSLAFALNQAKN